jgi:ketosteroid isomerase-like protein
MPTFDFAQVIEQHHGALEAFVRGDPEPLKALFSRRDDVTVANPFGLPARGWTQVAQTMERAASNYRDGEATGFERVSDYATADLAYTVEVERYIAKVGATGDLAPIALRVTTILRREEDGWRIVHRHADPITSPRPPESVLAAP